ncbi:MAG: adenosylcobinamide-phosphate synthase CbiB [Clostridium sp.]|nr:adenosylcobinamide-phosphate synthase CbiB [Clostridium sp.]
MYFLKYIHEILIFLNNSFTGRCTDLIVAVIIDYLIGDPYGFPHPVIYIGRLIRLLEKLGRKTCKNNRALKCFGLIIVIIICSVSYIVPFLILKVTHRFVILNHILNITILWTVLAAKSLKTEAMKVYKNLKENDINEAKKSLSYIVGRDTKDLSENEIIRADVETVAENTSDGVIAPMIFAVLGGAPLAMLYKGVNTMDSMLGYKNKKYYYIGFFPAKVDDVFNFIPARITGVLMCIVSPIVGGNIVKSFKIMIRDRKNHKSPNCAYPEAAASGALKVQLGGINSYFGEIMEKPTIGDKINKLNVKNIKCVCILMYATEILFLFIYILVMGVIKL